MAEKKEEKEGGEEAAKGGGKKKLIIIVVVLLVLIGGGVGAFLALGKSGGGEEGGDEEHAGGEEAGGEGEHGEEGMELVPAVMPLDTFIVNLQVKGSFLKCTVQLEFAEPELPPTIEHDTPRIRDAIISVLSAKAAPELLSSDGKEKLREELKRAVNDALHSEDVTKVFFTEFIIQ